MTDLRNILLNSIEEGGKRRTVKAACLECRNKKQKCDGRRPCSRCAAREFDCIFDTGVNETPRQASKRKYHEVVQARNDGARVLQELVSSSEPDALAALKRLRAGESVRSIASRLNAGRVRDTAASRYEQLLQQSAVLTICQSTAALEQLVPLAVHVLSQTTRMSLVGQASVALRDKIISLEMLIGILSGNDNASLYLEHSGASPHVHNFFVPAQPWTELTSSDEAVSHLVSVFLRFANPYWCVVEEDVFLSAMRDIRTPVSQYCSPLLVNAICAWASLYSEIDEAFKVRAQHLTRGNHFHAEARRLWDAEADQPSIATVSALLIMAVDSATRGKDKLAPEFCAAAIEALSRLPSDDPGPARHNSAQTYDRARRNVAMSVVWEEFSNAVGLLRPVSSLKITTQALPVLHAPSDTFTYWTGFPLTKHPVKLRGELLLYERRTLTGFMEELLLAVAPGHGHQTNQMLGLAKNLGDRMRAWHNALHEDLHYAATMPTPLFEFHAQYRTLVIRLYNTAWRIAFGDSGSDITENVDSSSDGNAASKQARETARQQFPLIALQNAYEGATLLRDFRNTYGMKICAPHIVEHAGESIFDLLQHLHRADRSQTTSPSSSSDTTTSTDQIDNANDAFVECFRTLLGAGTQLMLPRALARMVYLSSVQLKIRLPESVERLLQVVADTNWAASDLDHLDSMWPNLAFKDDLYVSGTNASHRRDTEMGILLRKWENVSIEDDTLLTAEQMDVGVFLDEST